MLVALLTLDPKIAVAGMLDDAPQFSGWTQGRWGAVTISKPPLNS